MKIGGIMKRINKLCLTFFLSMFYAPIFSMEINDFSSQSSCNNFSSYLDSNFSSDSDESADESVDKLKIIKGKIVLILGISCSGKTTVARRLSENLNLKYISADDITDTEIDKYENGDDDSSSDDSLEDLIFQIEELTLKKQRPKKQDLCYETDQFLMIQKAKKLADEGTNIICDIVPVNAQNENITNQIITTFTKNGYTIYTILVYADYKTCLSRIHIRSKNGKIKSEIRYPLTLLQQFTSLYTKAPSTPRKRSNSQIKANLNSPELYKQCLSSSTSSFMQQRVWDKATDAFFSGINTKNEITEYIIPIDTFNFIFNTSNEKEFSAHLQCATTLLNIFLKT